MQQPRGITDPSFVTECSSFSNDSSLSHHSNDLFVLDDKHDLQGRELAIVTSVWNPFIIRHQEENATKYTGLCMDLLDILSSTLNFTYTITEPPDGSWGQQLSNGTWIGMTGMLHRKEVDVALAGMSVTADRATVSDHTTGFFYDEMVLVTKRPNPVPVGWTFYTRPFHWTMYVLLGCGLVLTVALLVCLERCHMRAHNRSPMKDTGTRGTVVTTPVMENLLSMLGAMVIRGTVPKMASSGAKVLLFCWLLASIATVATYTGKLTANALLAKQPLPFTSLSELVTRNDYKWGFAKGTMHETVLSKSSIPDYQLFYRKALEFAKDDPDLLSADFDHLVVTKLLEGKNVKLDAKSHYQFLKSQHCELEVVKERLFQDSLAIHLQKDSPYTDLFNNALTKAKELGLLDYLTRKWIPKTTVCYGDETHVRSVSLELVKTAFVMAAVGVALASSLLMLECFLSRRHPIPFPHLPNTHNA